jgi:hypothetical protein
MRHPLQLLAGFGLLLVGCAGAAGADDGQGATLPAGGSGGADTSMSLGGSAGGSTAGTSVGGTDYADVGGGGTAGSSAGETAAGGTASAGSATGGSGSSELGGSGGSGGAEMPPGPIDYRMWSLQLPIGSGTSPTTIKPAQLLAGFMNEYFYPADDGGQMFMDPVTGVTTSGSQHCRTEMREGTLDGAQAAWSASATNRMTVEGKIIKGSGATVTIGQILNGTDSFPLCEFEWSSGKGGFQLFYEEAKGGGETIALNTAWPQNQRYSFTLELSNNKLIVSINGKQVYTRSPGQNILTKKFYFKFGNYDQNTSAGAASTTPHSIVEAYKVDVVHQ